MGINLALGQITAVIHLPIFLDTVGTVLVAGLSGTWVALATGFLSQLVFTVVSGNFTWLWFLPVQLAVAIYAGMSARLGVFRSVPTTLAGGIGLGIVAAVLSWPISFYIFGGVTGGGVSAVITALRGAGVSLGWSVLLGGLVSDVIDKTVTFLLVRTVLTSLPDRMKARFPVVTRALGRA